MKDPTISAAPESTPLVHGEACKQVLRMFSMFANEKRFRILCELSDGDRCVREIAEIVESTISNVSQQLKILTLAGYLERRRVQRSVYYHLSDERIRDVLAYLRSKFASG